MSKTANIQEVNDERIKKFVDLYHKNKDIKAEFEAIKSNILSTYSGSESGSVNYRCEGAEIRVTTAVHEQFEEEALLAFLEKSDPENAGGWRKIFVSVNKDAVDDSVLKGFSGEPKLVQTVMPN